MGGYSKIVCWNTARGVNRGRSIGTGDTPMPPRRRCQRSSGARRLGLTQKSLVGRRIAGQIVVAPIRHWRHASATPPPMPASSGADLQVWGLRKNRLLERRKAGQIVVSHSEDGRHASATPPLCAAGSGADLQVSGRTKKALVGRRHSGAKSLSLRSALATPASADPRPCRFRGKGRTLAPGPLPKGEGDSFRPPGLTPVGPGLWSGP